MWVLPSCVIGTKFFHSIVLSWIWKVNSLLRTRQRISLVICKVNTTLPFHPTVHILPLTRGLGTQKTCETTGSSHSALLFGYHFAQDLETTHWYKITKLWDFWQIYFDSFILLIGRLLWCNDADTTSLKSNPVLSHNL